MVQKKRRVTKRKRPAKKGGTRSDSPQIHYSQTEKQVKLTLGSEKKKARGLLSSCHTFLFLGGDDKKNPGKIGLTMYVPIQLIPNYINAIQQAANLLQEAQNNARQVQG